MEAPHNARLAIPHDGFESVWIRLAGPSDRDVLIEAFSGLSTQSRYSRFFTAMRSLEGPLIDQLLDIDGYRHIAVAAFVDTEGSERGIGVARSIRTADSDNEAELAVTIIDEFQHHGIGELLLRTVIAIAAASGVRQFTAMILSENRASLALFRKLGSRHVVSDDPSVRHLELSPNDVATPAEWDADFRQRVDEFVKSAVDG